MGENLESEVTYGGAPVLEDRWRCSTCLCFERLWGEAVEACASPVRLLRGTSRVLHVRASASD